LLADVVDLGSGSDAEEDRSPRSATDGYSPLPNDGDVDDAPQFRPLHPLVQQIIEQRRGEEAIADGDEAGD
jgi:hypothetical protein